MKQFLILAGVALLTLIVAVWSHDYAKQQQEEIKSTEMAASFVDVDRSAAVNEQILDLEVENIRRTLGPVAASQYRLCMMSPPTQKKNQKMCDALIAKVKHHDAMQEKNNPW